MPNKKSAEKRVRISERNRLYNRFWKSRCKTAAKRLLESLEGKDPQIIRARLDEAQSVLDKAAGKGVLHPNTVARRKSALTLKAKEAMKADA
ncbi:MAG: 30S ribosomal protein S20 [Synergistaceae bacterium]|nr:30S ribosomal protein S20 [Synergistaceae bacterium]